MAGASFDSLCAEREALRNYVLIHAKSLRAFREEGRPWYRRGEALDESGEEHKVRHLTTTASCLESLSHVPLYDNEDPPPPCPPDADDVRKELDDLTKEFAAAALQLRKNEWKSENERLIYSRVRTLPVILCLTEYETLTKYRSKISSHLKYVWERLEISDSKAQGIAEQASGGKASSRKTYPPNAFHTYWAIRLLQEYKKHFPDPEMDDREAVARLWARRTLAVQTALINGEQRTFDAHQLAWALSTDVLCREDQGDRPTTADHQHIELYDAALAAFFREQKDGRWPLYEPLFHYSQAGNAYCYTYETLSELLRLSLQKDSGRILRDHLRQYAGNLIEAWHYARETALELEDGGKGWCSGHHPHSTEPEAWATASVFSYLQNLRCLVGHWTAKEAKQELSVHPATASSPEDGEKTLKVRGTTWHREGTQTVARQLAMLFLHPLKSTETENPTIDPDRPLVDESRSAVLFGPPGTSKTTVIEGLAAALAWDYVEIHASHFLSSGMDRVPERADAIFQKLMELDRCVILFDEIDELIRLRNDADSDPFGRFLTTSMLPKIAKLWEQRRVLFFVATNDIEAADPAIKRSQRFDAAIFVPPPSHEKKKAQLEERLGTGVELSYEEVQEALAGEDAKEAALGVFALLRWDQIADLAHRITAGEREGRTAAQALRVALDELGDELARTDWKSSRSAGLEAGGAKQSSAEGHQELFQRWRQQELEERRDYRRVAVLGLSPGQPVAEPPSGWKPYGSNQHYLAIGKEVEGALGPDMKGTVELSEDGWKATDSEGIFYFTYVAGD